MSEENNTLDELVNEQADQILSDENSQENAKQDNNNSNNNQIKQENQTNTAMMTTYINTLNNLIIKYGTINDIICNNDKLNALKNEAIQQNIILEKNGNALKAMTRDGKINMSAIDGDDGKIKITARATNTNITNNYNNKKEKNEKKGLSGWQIFLIIFAILCVIAAIIILIVSLKKEKHKNSEEKNNNPDAVKTKENDPLKNEQGGTVTNENGKNITTTTNIDHTTANGNQLSDVQYEAAVIESNPNLPSIIKNSTTGEVLSNNAMNVQFDNGYCYFDKLNSNGKIERLSIPIDHCQMIQNGKTVSRATMIAADLYSPVTKQFENNGKPLSLEEVNQIIEKRL